MKKTITPRSGHHNKTREISLDEIDLAQKYLSLCKETGQFNWIKKPGRSIDINSSPGTIRPDGYLRIHLNGKSYLAHRLAYAFYHGPTIMDIDHIDGNKLNNSIDNLRKSTHSNNQHNSKRKKTAGVSFDKKCPIRPWAARFNYNKKPFYLGQFSEREQALDAVISKKKSLGLF